MKLSLCFLALLFAFASCEAAFGPQKLFLRRPKASEATKEGPHCELAQFYLGLFDHFGLDKPYQIIFECLNDFSSGVFLESMYTFNDLLIDMKARDSRHAHHDFIKEWILSILGHGASGCIVATQDFSNLVEALDIKRDPLLDSIGQWLYFQADYEDLLDDYQPVIKHLEHKNFSAAGAAYGDVLNNTVQAVKSKGFYWLGHKGVANGFSIGLDIDLPNDSLKAWNDTTAAYDLEFLWESSKAVAEGKWWDSWRNLEKFWEEKGKDIMAKIPDSVWEALKASDDNKKVTEKLGIDVMTKEFGEKAAHWIKKNQWKYHGYAKDVLRNLEHMNTIHVGALQAAFVKLIAKSK